MLPDTQMRQLVGRIENVPRAGKRRLIALVGSPASGKTTLSYGLSKVLPRAAVVPMDGFHLDNRLLDMRDLRSRKGAPDSFDVAGFVHLIRRLKTDDEVIYPLFDRSQDIAIAGAGCIGPETDTVLVEGNYLLLDRPGWRDLAPLWDLSIYLSVPEDILRVRLMTRWRDHGFDEAGAAAKTHDNDLPNARFVAAHLISPDITVETTSPS